MNIRKLVRASTLLVCGLFATLAQSAFDPVHEDIDIFMVNPAVSSDRPNVLILMDNTANWNQAFTNEKSALVQVLNGLDAKFNVGLGMFVETGNPNDNVDGAYVRFAVRQMSGSFQSTLTNMVNDLDKLGDKGNNNTIGLAMSEVYKYFSGGTSYSSYGKVKTDYTSNSLNPAGSLAGNALPSTHSASDHFNSPVASDCQKNFIIYIGNGKFNENSSAQDIAKSRLAAALGSTPSTLAISPSGQQSNWADEWADFMANTGFNMTFNGVSKKVFVNTYAVAIDPASQNLWGSGSTASTNDSLRLMKSMSEDHGNGKFFTVSSGSGGSEIAEALKKIFDEIQSVNSVFASTTLPVSINVRGTNLNQVYMGMFRPDAKKAPRWYGNLKLYTLKLDSTGSLYLADALGARAEDSNSGFIGASRSSYWTHDSTFWDFRTSTENGTGGSSDNPDGNVVEKGAAAQRLRETFASSQSARNLYTCTSGTATCNACTTGGSGSAKTCTNGSSLSSTPFATTNDGITAAGLGLGTKDVTSLSAKVTRTISSLTDRRAVTLNNSSGTSVSVTVSNGAAASSVSSLSTANTLSLTRLTGSTGGTITNITDATSGSGGSKTNTFTVTTTYAHGLAVGDSITISGNTASGGSDINSTFTVASVPSTTTFTFNGANGNVKFGTNGTVVGKATSSTAYATLANHGYANADQVTIAGAVPTGFNGTYGITVIDSNTFKYTMSSAQGAATTFGTATANTTTAKATTSTALNLAAGNQVTISGAANAGYNGTFTVLASPAPSANSFYYTVASKLAPDTSTSITAYKVGSGSTTVTGTSAAAHGLVAGTTYNMSGPDSCYTNGGSITVASVPTSTTFTYTTGSTCTSPPGTGYVVAATGTGATVTATLPSHNFASQCPTGSNVTIYGTDANHTGTWGPITVVDSNTFTYSTTIAKPFPNGNFTAACATNPRAFATASGHGFATNDTITVSGVDTSGSNAGNSVYNTTTASTYVIDTDNFSYPLTAAPAGTATTTSSITASKNTTTATAYVASHGFSNGSSVIISGATPAAFNGTQTIANVTTNTFTYTLGSAQGDASGTIVASSGSGTNTERDLVIDWVRGQDNNEDENKDNLTTDCRASVHGDVLHSRPAVINYNRYGGNNDVYVFYGGNDGVFHAIKGGTTNDASDPTSLQPGYEAWGFVPQESFSSLKRLRNNTPVIGGSFKKPYFMDGPIGSYTVDANGDGQMRAADNDLVYLYIGARRGGRYIYSLDVSDPVAPKNRWKISNTTSGFSELGYSWSQPTVVTGVTNYTNPILIIGGGYDPAVEDIENCTIQSATSTSVKYFTGPVTYQQTGCVQDNGTDASGNPVTSPITSTSTPNATVSRSMGRAIYVVDAITGERIWWAGRTGSGADLEVSGMDYAIPGDPIVVRNLSGGPTNRAYFGDTGGNVWRFDFGDADRANWKVTKIASLSNLANAADRRKFLYPPDVVRMSGFDAVLIGSGDREHPFDMTVTNRFYMLEDKGNDNGPLTGTDADHPTLTEADLFNATTDSRTTASASATTAQKDAALADFSAGIANKEGWYVSFVEGEKDVGGAVALNGVVFFNTNVSPMSPLITSSACSNLGIANQYQINFATIATTKTVHNGGGYLPSPVHVVVEVEVTTTDPATGQQITTTEPIEGVISGPSVQKPTGVSLGTRLRRFWYKEID